MLKRMMTVAVMVGLLALCMPAEGFELGYRGWIEAGFYPPHNEYDPNPGVPLRERVVARYSLEAEGELWVEEFPRLFVFAKPAFYFGDSRPKYDYNYQADPIALNLIYGAGVVLSQEYDLQLRWSHGEWIDLGGYQGEKLVWNAIKVRWTFGR